MKTHIPAQFYLYDYKSLFVRASVTTAVGIIVRSSALERLLRSLAILDDLEGALTVEMFD